VYKLTVSLTHTCGMLVNRGILVMCCIFGGFVDLSYIGANATYFGIKICYTIYNSR